MEHSPRLSVGLQSVLWQMTDLIQMLFGMVSGVTPGIHVLDGVMFLLVPTHLGSLDKGP